VDVRGVHTDDAQLLLTVPAGRAHDVWTAGNASLRVMQSASNTDFQIEVKFESPLTQRWQLQGLLVEEGLGRYLRFNFQYDGSVRRLLCASLVNNAPTLYLNAEVPASVPQYMRVNRTGNRWTVSYSADGTTWTQAVAFNFTLTVTAVGVLFRQRGDRWRKRSGAHGSR